MVNISTPATRIFVGSVPKDKTKQEFEAEFRRIGVTNVSIYFSWFYYSVTSVKHTGIFEHVHIRTIWYFISRRNGSRIVATRKTHFKSSSHVCFACASSTVDLCPRELNLTFISAPFIKSNIKLPIYTERFSSNKPLYNCSIFSLRGHR